MADFRLTVDGKRHEVSVAADTVTVDGQGFAVRVEPAGANLVVVVDGRPYYVEVGESAGDLLIVGVDGNPREVQLGHGLRHARPSPRTAAVTGAPAPQATGGRVVPAPMAGRIARVAVVEGDVVEAGALLLILEAMKMENEIRAPIAGTVARVLTGEGDRVTQGAPLVEIA